MVEEDIREKERRKVYGERRYKREGKKERVW